MSTDECTARLARARYEKTDSGWTAGCSCGWQSPTIATETDAVLAWSSHCVPGASGGDARS